MKYISNLLKKDIIQRTLYSIALLFVTYMFWGRLIHNPYDESIYGLNFVTLYSILFVLLFVQIVRNNKVFWMLTICLFITHILYSVGWTILQSSGKDITFNGTDTDVLAIILLVLLLVLFITSILVLYKMKPEKLI